MVDTFIGSMYPIIYHYCDSVQSRYDLYQMLPSNRSSLGPTSLNIENDGIATSATTAFANNLVTTYRYSVRSY